MAYTLEDYHTEKGLRLTMMRAGVSGQGQNRTTWHFQMNLRPECYPVLHYRGQHGLRVGRPCLLKSP